MFIMQWLLAAQKHKQYPRTLASDIIWLQEQGKQYEPSTHSKCKNIGI
ncbi:hypothetical protein GYRE_02390 [Yokenella regensburgei ATCC 49455]|nr:hypothetical protein GYRE_02390 [Yokenella regensburgei ATCC 49455]